MLHLVGCNLELYYDARTHEYQMSLRYLISTCSWLCVSTVCANLTVALNT